MTHRILLLFFLFGASHIAAQPLEFGVSWGHAFDGPARSTLHDIIGHDASGIYAIRIRYGTVDLATYTLERYDHKFMPARSRNLEIIENGEPVRIQYVLYIKGRIYVFYVVRNYQTQKGELFARQVNKNTLVPERDRIKLGQADDGKFSKETVFKFRTSRDSSKVAVSYEFPNLFSETKSYGFFVLDEYLQVLWRPKVAVSHNKELFFVENFKVDNAGTVYVLGVSFMDKRRTKREGKPNYSYEILAWSPDDENMRSYPVALEDRFLTDMQIEVIDTKTLVCAGFYSAKGTYSIRGTYFLTIDVATKKIKTSSMKEFGSEVVTQNLTERDASAALKSKRRGEDHEMFQYDLDKLLVGKDGSAILVGEQYFIEEVTTTTLNETRRGGLSVTTDRNYHYNDILAVKIDPQGQILWAQKIAKSQRTTNDGGYSSSYAMAIVRGQICFFFNDRPENIKYTGVGRPLPYYTKKSIVMMVSINQRGEQTRQSVFAPRDIVVTRPRACEQISNREVVLFGQRLTTNQFASVAFD